MLSRQRKPSAIAEPLRDRDLVRLHWPVGLRPAFDALFEIDDALAEVVVRSTEPTLAAIKLAWWREALERIDGDAPPAEPRLQAVAAELLPRGITGAELAGLEPGWATLLDALPRTELIEARGALLFELGARLLGGGSAGISEAGRLYAAMDVTRRALLNLKNEIEEPDLPRFPVPVRPLTGLACLARRDRLGDVLEPEATPGRSWALMRHRISGRV